MISSRGAEAASRDQSAVRKTKFTLAVVMRSDSGRKMSARLRQRLSDGFETCTQLAFGDGIKLLTRSG